MSGHDAPRYRELSLDFRRIFSDKEYAPRRDLAIILLLYLVILAASLAFDSFDHVIDFVEQHEDWEIDEALTGLLLLPIALGIFAARRLSEAKKELKLRLLAEKQAHEMALHDPLTGLPNRRKANMVIEAALKQADSAPVTLLAIDLNRFKPVNDLYGHQAGDQLLLAVGERLKAAVADDGLISRIGGDEFCAMLSGIPAGDQLIRKVETLSEVFETPFLLGDLSVVVSASIGVVTTDVPDTPLDSLFSQADAAMYRCKGTGRNEIAFFEAGMEQAAIQRAKIETDLRTAIVEGEIRPFFQPLVNLYDGEILGFEALARWHMADGTMRMPDDFITIAEETGLISDLFFVILKAAAIEAKNWPVGLHFAVNLSPVQFGDEWLVERILQTLVDVGVAPGRLEIEITESALVSDLDVARNVIVSLKNQGINISLDDFGTGYSSLRHLSELPFDKLKIDRSFVHGIETNSASQSIVRAVTALAHNLGLQVTAEGIETYDNAKSVMDSGCDIGQGFLYGRPSRGGQLALPDGSRLETGGEPQDDSVKPHGEKAA
ncbi:GGDEF-domain containing protein [Sphingopyxis sp. BSNA05]|nr:GGDEF-domain containing protein [Sphingopyxis sp. BSNA05]